MNPRARAEQAVSLRPSSVCARLLAALDASDGRRRRRKRDTAPDAIGLEAKRCLLEQAVADDPDSQEFESWLVERCAQHESPSGPPGSASGGAIRAMAIDVLAEWRMAEQQPGFWRWLEEGAPSDDR